MTVVWIGKMKRVSAEGKTVSAKAMERGNGLRLGLRLVDGVFGGAKGFRWWRRDGVGAVVLEVGRRFDLGVEGERMRG